MLSVEVAVVIRDRSEAIMLVHIWLPQPETLCDVVCRYDRVEHPKCFRNIGLCGIKTVRISSIEAERPYVSPVPSLIVREIVIWLSSPWIPRSRTKIMVVRITAIFLRCVKVFRPAAVVVILVVVITGEVMIVCIEDVRDEVVRIVCHQSWIELTPSWVKRSEEIAVRGTVPGKKIVRQRSAYCTQTIPIGHDPIEVIA
jgi:hypothetical protein